MRALCGGVSSRRGLLAALWSLLTIITFICFLIAFSLSGPDENQYNDDDREPDDRDPQVGVTSRALFFAALWTAVLAILLSIFGAVVLGWQSPTGEYYTCCAPRVHRTTPLSLGTFLGGLIMFAGLNLACSVLFGEFEVSVELCVVCV